jgi:hypothetical protein
VISAIPFEVAAVATVLEELTVPWAVAGGWAIDLALGRVTRAHHDVDISVFRADQAALRADLASWTFEMVRHGTRLPWPAELRLEPPVFEVYGRPLHADPTHAVEFLLEERGGEEWLYRRDPAIGRPIARVLRRGPELVSILAPEIVLLYKSKSPRATDEHDFDVGLELLDAEGRDWLRSAIATHDPGHPWVARLRKG